MLFAFAGLIGCDTVEPPEEPEVVPVDHMPAWSPDGRYIAYLHRAGPTEDPTDVTGLYVLDLEADSMWLVTEGLVTSPDWHPNGERLAFAAGDIFTIRPDGSDLRRVTNHGRAFFPSWAPNGKRIAYDATSLSQKGIWLISSGGKARKHLGLGRSADWSPSGEKIVYQGPPGQTDSENQIWFADTTGSDKNQLTTNAFVINRYPTWSPNGEWVAWIVADNPSPKNKPFCQVRVMRSDGLEAGSVAECAVMSITWGPNSKYLVFAKSAPDGRFTALWTVRRDGSELRQLTDPSRNPLN